MLSCWPKAEKGSMHVGLLLWHQKTCPEYGGLLSTAEGFYDWVQNLNSFADGLGNSWEDFSQGVT